MKYLQTESIFVRSNPDMRNNRRALRNRVPPFDHILKDNTVFCRIKLNYTPIVFQCHTRIMSITSWIRIGADKIVLGIVHA